MLTSCHPVPLLAFAAFTIAGSANASGGNAVHGVAWSTYYGESGAEQDPIVATASDGGVFLAGGTRSDQGLATHDADQAASSGDWDAVLVHLDDDGERRWSTYFGGAHAEQPTALAVTESGSVVLAGSTRSADRIAADDAYQNCIDGGQDGFLAEFSDHGERLWSTYFGGDGEDTIHALAVDHEGTLFVCGTTTSDYGLATAEAQQEHRSGKADAFLASFDNDGNVRWSTYYGGTGEDACLGLAVHGDRVYLTGRTTSHDTMSTRDAFQRDYGGDEDAFVAVFDRDGARLWSTYHGGDAQDRGEAIAVDDRGEVYVAGTTHSPGAIADPHAHQQCLGGGDDLFLVRFSDRGVRLWGTYYGGEDDEARAELAVRDGRIVLAGDTRSSSSIASANAMIDALHGDQDLFFVEFDRHGDRLRASYFGGENHDHGVSLAFRGDDALYLAGTTRSHSGIATEDALDETLSGAADLFVAFLDIDGSAAPKAVLDGPAVILATALRAPE